ncbi:hypothetical protein CGRA01v4_02585 [Colletotrichum graminicola]|nr:hypothetical protein CGRA01v4_02585 [Colletotrichum graminicola]
MTRLGGEPCYRASRVGDGTLPDHFSAPCTHSHAVLLPKMPRRIQARLTISLRTARGSHRTRDHHLLEKWFGKCVLGLIGGKYLSSWLLPSRAPWTAYDLKTHLRDCSIVMEWAHWEAISVASWKP